MVSIADGLRARGREEGILLGIEQGVYRGMHQEKVSLAKRLLDRGADIDTVSDLTELRIEEVLKLKQHQFS